MPGKTAGNPLRKKLLFVLLVLLPLLVMAGIFIKAAWVSDDAYITFRTIDNFLNGYGLRWNVAERVQTYTHPLWMWLVMFAVFFSREYYLTVVVLSLVLALLSVVLVLRKISPHVFASFMAIAVLISSKAFVDYTTSGLENPLSFLLMAVFAILLFKGKATLQNFGWLCFVACLATVNRMDTILLYLPAVVVSGFILIQKQKLKWWQLLKVFLLAFAPFIFWEIFSIIYYGFPFPNTAYAKLSIDIPLKNMVYKGHIYFLDSLSQDYLTLPFIGLSVLLAMVYRSRRSIALAVGTGLYLLFVLYIGGDFMSGRFFSLPFFTAVILMLHLPLGKIPTTTLAIASVAIGLLIPEPVLLYNKEYHTELWRKTGIADERGFYYQCAGLVPLFPQPLEPTCEWVGIGREYKQKNLEVAICGAMGFRGFYAGPSVRLVDTFGLTDPFLGRLPCNPSFRIGHFSRGVPAGYEATVRQGKNLLENPKQRELYDVIAAITRDPVFSWKRFREILKINLGFYNDLRVNPGVRPEKE